MKLRERWRLWKNRTKIGSFFNKCNFLWIKHVKNKKNLKFLFLVYIAIVVISSLLLWSPWTQNLSPSSGNTAISYIDAIFTTSSAFSDTGLVVKDTYKHWNIFGQAIIAILIFAGGVGIFALKIFIFNWIFRRKNISILEMKLLQSERGGTDSAKVGKLVISAVKFLVLTIILFGFILSVYFYFTDINTTSGIKEYLAKNGEIDANGVWLNSPKGDLAKAFRFGFFHTISAINNAGFDIMSGFSLMPYYTDYFVQICFITLFIIGGLGYPVLFDLKGYFSHKIKRKKSRYHFTLFTKLSLSVYFLVFLFGLATSLGFELTSTNIESMWNKLDSSGQNYFYGNVFNRLFGIFFTSFSTRSAGFFTVHLKDFSLGSTITFMIMMFIGASPASTGGGVRTTTIGVFLMSIFNMVVDKPRVRIFKRAIKKDTVDMSSKVLGIAFIIVIVACFICFSSFSDYGGKIITSASQADGTKVPIYGAEHILFEVASAFGTTGLSSGITASLNTASKITILIVMFIGQFGISSTLLVWKRKRNNHRSYEYAEDDVAIG
ncbi:hypothetical protein VO56_00615 [Mycoplasmopsis gallinacea]|uniref:Ktr system potassium uptake protein B n=1 Tax=Mycoplasmopsis gallinacea TaxID=29556 RepID=A0A0D5ZJ79_9BACT|nr:hypothetical protein VO56_00615 [Mycoplasmopsis gallinacea]